MQLSFVETMSGTVRGEDGVSHPISFDVSAAGRGGGHFELRGVVSAPPWAPSATVEGTLTISPLKPAITYHLHFTALDGRRLELNAQKTPSLLRPLGSMTWMPAVLQDADARLVARGEMRFDLKDVLVFAASWLPGPRTQQRRLDVRRRAIDRHLMQGG